MFKRLAVAFSLANLCFFQTWREVLSQERFSYLYFWQANPRTTATIALVINLALWTTIFFLISTLIVVYSRELMKNLARVGFLALFLRALNGVRIQYESLGTHALRLRFGRVGLLLVGLSLLGLLCFAISHFGLNRITRVAVTIMLVLAPFGLLALGQAGWQAVRYRNLWQEHSAAVAPPSVKVDRSPRVLWLIFDEMDQNIAFDHRPADLNLPEFDRLRSEALSATNAFPPAGHTSQSIPALLTGKLIASVAPAGPNDLLLRFPEKPESVSWSKQPDIFTAVRAKGLNTSLVGWYHPYCRIIGDRLDRCVWQAAGQLSDPADLNMDTEIWRQEVNVLALAPDTGDLRDTLTQRTPHAVRAAHLADYQILLAEARSAVVFSEPGLTFVHLSVPHPPYVYDRQRRAFEATGRSQYADNLALADVALGELRQTMEKAGLWDRTTIVISSDHWWRKDYWQERQPLWTTGDASGPTDRIDHRVPFLIKLPGQQSALTYETSFNTVLTYDLILAVLDGGISEPAQVGAWLDQHRTIGESPYQAYDDPQ